MAGEVTRPNDEMNDSIFTGLFGRNRIAKEIFVWPSHLGMGGVFNTTNSHLYHYAGNNPVRYVDPSGRNEEDYKRFEEVCKTVGSIGGMGIGFIKGYLRGTLKALPYFYQENFRYVYKMAIVNGVFEAVDGYSQGLHAGKDFAKTFEYYNGQRRDMLNKAYFKSNPFNPHDTSSYKRFPDYESAFHQVPGCDIGKFETLNADKNGGYPEIVWNYTTDSEIVFPRERGTYNYGHGFLQHGIKDVIPWIVLGTGINDPSTMKERSESFFNSIPNYINGILQK